MADFVSVTCDTLLSKPWNFLYSEPEKNTRGIYVIGQEKEPGRVTYLYMGMSTTDISYRLRNHIVHESRIFEQKINEKINKEIENGNKDSLKVKWISVPNVDLTDRKFYLDCVENKLGYTLPCTIGRVTKALLEDDAL